MDEELRKSAKLKIANAKHLERRHVTNELVISEYLQGIELFLQIKTKSVDDFKAISDAYYYIATIHFNAKNYTHAGECYLAAINQLLQTELNDDTYRKLTELYIDLADACYELFNQPAGDEAMTNAIKAFGLIKNKTFEEKEIGDPVANFKQFHSYYEKQLSTDSYIRSSRFSNHEQLLGAEQFARQQEKDLFDMFGTISISEFQQIDQSIESMLSQLSLSTQQHFFNPVSISEAPSDSAYRKMAMQFLSLAQSHFQKRMIPDAIATYQQAIKALKAITAPKENDQQIIQTLEQQIDYFKSKPKPSESHFFEAPPLVRQDHQRTVSVTSGMGFFNTSSVPTENTDTPELSAMEDDSMNLS